MLPLHSTPSFAAALRRWLTCCLVAWLPPVFSHGWVAGPDWQEARHRGTDSRWAEGAHSECGAVSYGAVNVLAWWGALCKHSALCYGAVLCERSCQSHPSPFPFTRPHSLDIVPQGSERTKPSSARIQVLTLECVCMECFDFIPPAHTLNWPHVRGLACVASARSSCPSTGILDRVWAQVCRQQPTHTTAPHVRGLACERARAHDTHPMPHCPRSTLSSASSTGVRRSAPPPDLAGFLSR